MQIKKFPHEFLARWGRDGSLQGYHIVTVDIACDDAGAPLKKDPSDPASENLLERFGEATTLERAGVTLDDLLAQLHSGALLSVDAANAAKAEALAAEASARSAEAMAQEERDSAVALATGLKTQLGDLTQRAATLSSLLADAQASLVITQGQLSLTMAELEALKAAPPAP